MVGIVELLKKSYRILLIILLCLLVLAIANQILSLNLIGFLTSGRGFDISLWNLIDPQASEGSRINLWRLSLKHFSENIFLGSGFLGCWSFSEYSSSCSFHSQHLDTIVRHGILLNSLFLIFSFQIFKISLKMYPPQLFLSFLAYFIFGFFNETYRLPDPSFVMSFLLWCSLKAPNIYNVNK